MKKRIVFFAVNLLAVYGPYLFLNLFSYSVDGSIDFGIAETLPMPLVVPFYHADRTPIGFSSSRSRNLGCLLLFPFQNSYFCALHLISDFDLAP